MKSTIEDTLIEKLLILSQRDKDVYILAERYEELLNDIYMTNFLEDTEKSKRDINKVIETLLTKREVVKIRPDILVNAYTRVGNIQRDRGFISGNDSSQNYYFKALELIGTNFNINSLANLYISIGATYEMQDKYQMALHYYDEAIKIINNKKYTEKIKSSALARIGCVLTKMNNVSNARKVLTKARILRENDIIDNDPSFILLKHATLNLKEGKIDNAFTVVSDIYDKSTIKTPLFKAQVLILLTDIVMRAGDKNEALNYAILAEKITNKYLLKHQHDYLIKLINNL